MCPSDPIVRKYRGGHSVGNCGRDRRPTISDIRSPARPDSILWSFGYLIDGLTTTENAFECDLSAPILFVGLGWSFGISIALKFLMS